MQLIMIIIYLIYHIILLYINNLSIIIIFILLYDILISTQRNLIDIFLEHPIFIFMEHIMKNMVIIIIITKVWFHLFIMVDLQHQSNIIMDSFLLLKSKKWDVNNFK